MTKQQAKRIVLADVDTLILSCREALSGQWDISGQEGLEGFEVMITLLKRVKDYVKIA
jgi:hypothetical protein